jgi:sodium-dependent dicarboxylate transporter 2/3/5
MLPVATPPNAIIFSSNRLTVAEMARAGALMSLATIFAITLWVWLVAAPWLTG